MMRWLLVLAACLQFLLAPVAMAQSNTPTPRDDQAHSFAQAIVNTFKANMERNKVAMEKQGTLLEKLKAYMASDPYLVGSWIEVARKLGVAIGTSLIKAGPRDDSYCQNNPSSATCAGFGGAGATGSWGDQLCDAADFLQDIGGNIIVPALPLPDPIMYRKGSVLWTVPNSPEMVTSEGLSALKVAIHLRNLPLFEADRVAPTYIVTASNGSVSVAASSPAYVAADATKAATYTAFQSNSFGTNLWGNAPDDAVCEGGIGSGYFTGHWTKCVNRPSAWSIPPNGVVGPGAIRAWSEGSSLAHCKVSDEFIRIVTDRSMQAICMSWPDLCPTGNRIEPEDVRNGGQQPTILDTRKDGAALPDPNGAATTPPSPDPTPTPSSSATPDWTDPKTQVPAANAPAASSLLFDWGFPEITLNLGSHECPTYTADFFGNTLTLDSHCPFIEQNRAVISAMMILLFTIAAGMIVLRA
jgi:hypothetical protein